MTRGCRSQHGIVLLTAIVLLAVMAVAGAAALHAARGSAAVAGSVRAQLAAREAAEAALHGCEAAIANGTVTVQPASLDDDPAQPARWRSLANWSGEAALAVDMAGTAATAARPAQCLVEAVVLPRAKGADEGESAYLVTARGFSGDARRALPLSRPGAEVWLQSFVRMPTPATRSGAS